MKWKIKLIIKGENITFKLRRNLRRKFKKIRYKIRFDGYIKPF